MHPRESPIEQLAGYYLRECPGDAEKALQGAADRGWMHSCSPKPADRAGSGAAPTGPATGALPEDQEMPDAGAASTGPATGGGAQVASGSWQADGVAADALAAFLMEDSGQDFADGEKYTFYGTRVPGGGRPTARRPQWR